MFILDTQKIDAWQTARKVKPLRAKPMSAVFAEATMAGKFLIDTLEGAEPVSMSSMFCVGEAGDAWQQTPEKLLAKYDISGIDASGWMVCVPKPENSVECLEITEKVLLAMEGKREGYIVGQWGQTVDGVNNLQAFSIGDFIARNHADRSDQWVVRRKIWLNTYVIE